MRLVVGMVLVAATLVAGCATSTPPTTPPNSTASSTANSAWSPTWQCRGVDVDAAAACADRGAAFSFGAATTCAGTEDAWDRERARVDACRADQTCPCACNEIQRCR